MTPLEFRRDLWYQKTTIVSLGPMAKDSYCENGEYFSIPNMEQLITNHNDRFLNRYQC